jgi:transcriptional regulator with XRE-family HTH domain
MARAKPDCKNAIDFRLGTLAMAKFDSEAFFSALNVVRAERSLTWKEVAAQAEVNASTLTRIGQGKRPDVNGLAALLTWSGLKAEMFMPASNDDQIEPLAQISSIIRRDKKLSKNQARLLEEIVTNTYRSLRSGSGRSK